MVLVILGSLVNRVGTIIMLAYLMSRVQAFRKLVIRREGTFRDKLTMATIFGLFGILGTYTGIRVHGAIANARIVGIFAGGLLGGPLVGVVAGLLAGYHRWIIDVGGFTAVACGVSTLLEGCMAGALSRRFYNAKKRWLFALVCGALAEGLQMLVILIVARPYQNALHLVTLIGIPMIVANSLGVTVFIAITETIFRDQEKAGASQAELALQVANKTLPYFRMGFNSDTAKCITVIILDMSDVDGVAITDTEKILAHVGAGQNHHISGELIYSDATKEVLKTGRVKVVNYREVFTWQTDKGMFGSAVIAPLLERGQIIGTLELYKKSERAMTSVDEKLALGLAQIFSTQIELRRIEKQSELLARAELRALQAQINPHFLFNAINTIVSFVRSNPAKARDLLLHLSNFFRNSLQLNHDEVSLAKEVEHIKSYLEIEKARFGDKLRVFYHLGGSNGCHLPPLILQPIVENAVKHGITQKIDGGTISIIAEDTPGHTRITVRDDGVGMKKEVINSLDRLQKKTGSIGIANVNSRLKSKYGEEYGLRIESKLGEGTTVTMVIPKI